MSEGIRFRRESAPLHIEATPEWDEGSATSKQIEISLPKDLPAETFLGQTIAVTTSAAIGPMTSTTSTIIAITCVTTITIESTTALTVEPTVAGSARFLDASGYITAKLLYMPKTGKAVLMFTKGD